MYLFTMNRSKKIDLEDILSEKDISCILNQTTKLSKPQLLKYEIRHATEGMSGFLGDHFKVTLHLKDSVKEINLFVKVVPSGNVPKAQFIDENNFFRRESWTFDIFENFPDKEFADPNPWGVRALVHNDHSLVLPDLSVEGHKTYPATQYLDLEHVLVALNSLARFHAAFSNYQTQINQGDERRMFHEEYQSFLEDSQFRDCAWLRAATKITIDILTEFSTSIKQVDFNLEESMTKWFIAACTDLRDYANVIIHKDLWANNVLFKYSEGKPVNAILIDFQCARYAPPAVDVMIFLYYTTSRRFREHHERDVLDYYYSAFLKSIDESTRNRLACLKYDRQAFCSLCDKLRPSGMVVPLAVLPFILMSSEAAQESFDDPSTFRKHFFEDRSDLVLRYARQHGYYKTRLLEISEEFAELLRAR